MVVQQSLSRLLALKAAVSLTDTTILYNRFISQLKFFMNFTDMLLFMKNSS